MDTSENNALFTDAGLAKYKAVIFLKTSGDILTLPQRNAFEKYFLPRTWPRTDEIYNFRANPRDSKSVTVHMLLTVDESTYKGGTPGKDHPMSWYDEYQGGRA